MTVSRFGLSTRLFLDERLDEHHIEQIARSGFAAVEVVATPAHFDCSDLTAAPRLATWLATHALPLHAVVAVPHASLASADSTTRAKAVDGVRAVIDLTQHVRFDHVIVPLGVPAAEARGGDLPGAARQSLEDLATAASDAGVRVAVEGVAPPHSTPDALVRLIEQDLDGAPLGICLDFGRAHLLGDLADAIEAVSGHLVTTHLHDNRRRTDDRLPPYAGSIDWDAAMMETQKIGYEGRLILDVGAHGAATATLARCVAARERLQQSFEWA